MLSIERLARRYWDAEESRDVTAILSYFRPDAQWHGPGRDSVGHAEIRGFYDESVAGFPVLAVRITDAIGTDDRAAVQWCAALTDTEGRFHQLHGVNIMEGTADQISFLRTYFDPSELDTVLDQPHAAH